MTSKIDHENARQSQLPRRKVDIEAFSAHHGLFDLSLFEADAEAAIRSHLSGTPAAADKIGRKHPGYFSGR